jgi:hypothetical protein
MANGERTEPSPENGPDALMPVGAWVRLEIPGQPGIVGFTYVDPQAGFSAQGWKAEGDRLDPSSRVIVRLPMPGVAWRRLEADEAGPLGLESPPSWVAEFYGPQPPAGSLWGAWREHPKLKGRFLPDHPDDLQVLVHDGGPRLSRNPAEAVWVTTTGIDGEVFRGRVLNQPHHLRSVRQGNEIKFIAADGAEFPIMVTDKYLQERGAWVIHPCRRCGFSELFDAPSDLIRVVFPNTPADAQMSMFTAFCPLCGGVQGVTANDGPTSEGNEPASAPQQAKRPWWKFW